MSSAAEASAKSPQWTAEQWSAITTRGSNVLVAAAAGSGKTAVLVERLIRMITDGAEPVDVDRLLVATFTKAAADEMRHRIREALEKRLEQEPDSDHLRKQLSLVGRASITTLHSFCMEVVQRYFSIIGVDPGFRIANDTEGALLRADVLEELFETAYGTSAEDSPLWRLADAYGGERGDAALYELVEKLYEFSRSHPWPEFWLKEVAAQFRVEEEPTLSPWIVSLLNDVKLELQGAVDALTGAMEQCERPGGPAPYRDSVSQELAKVRELCELAEQGDWDKLQASFQGELFGRLKPVKAGDADADAIERVKELRQTAKKQVESLRGELFGRPLSAYIEDVRTLAPLMETLAELVLEFGRQYAKAKADRGIVDFSDLEHYALAILRDPASTPERLIPSGAALAYREQFAEVLLDEYQDTNRVQEAIVELVSKDGAGNRFMVGDVKQSIYRFRLAEPELFMDKYKRYGAEGGSGDPAGGRRIDLARNFRSRQEVVDGVNFLFKQIMHESAAEMDYDERAKLVCGASYPDEPKNEQFHGAGVDLLLVDTTFGEEEAGARTDDSAETAGESDEASEGDGYDAMKEEAREMETAALEARLIAERIRLLMGGAPGVPAMRVFDRKEGTRPLAYRDIVILLRSVESWAPAFLEQLRLAGIPAYADLSTGYFNATEVEVMLSLLQTIDNPQQDIPFAGVLRSPIVGIHAEELAQIRLFRRGGTFYEAAAALASGEEGAEQAGSVSPLREKLGSFLSRLAGWRTEARQGSLADLLWKLYRETGYYDFVGGLPGGLQRQANLRALYDRARGYEATSLRGLFRFLRFIERMRDSGSDLGAARALGEQEDVVRIMTIHKSKGLEFPVVFVAGMGKKWNQMDLNAPFLLHKQLGFGPRYFDGKLRVSYPSLPMAAIRRRLRRETLAEEMRVLYVALTRAKEKLILCGTVRGAAKALRAWSGTAEHDAWPLPGGKLLSGTCYLDWIGPAVYRHPQAAVLHERAGTPVSGGARLLLSEEPSKWSVIYADPSMLAQAAAAKEEADPRMLAAVERLQPVPALVTDAGTLAVQRLGWAYPNPHAPKLFAKTSITEMKRLESSRIDGEHAMDGLLLSPRGEGAEGDGLRTAGLPFGMPSEAGSTAVSGERSAGQADEQDSGALPAFTPVKKPRFLEKQKLTATERGVAYHTVMQHMPLGREVTPDMVRDELAKLVSRRLLTEDQQASVDAGSVVAFFETEIGRRMLHAGDVRREVPFSLGMKASEVYGAMAAGIDQETVLVQGVIDCFFADDRGTVLLDFKTDAIYGGKLGELTERYRFQLSVYRRALELALRKPINDTYLYFFNGPHLVRV